MEDELVLSLDGKNLGNLRVVDLKQQLEKRGLSKSGSKKDLVKRLKSQLEFEKLGEERKLGSGGDLKLELDAATEQNEFVRQYLARQQKLLAEQNTSDHSSESEEIQNSDDEQCDSPHVHESNAVISEKSVSESGGSEDKTCFTEKKKIANLENDTDNIACSDKKGDNQVDKIDTNAIIMPSSKDLSTSNMLCDQDQTHMEKADCSSVPYSLSDIQLPESPKKESKKANFEKESKKLVDEKEGVKIVVLKESAKLVEEEGTKSSAKTGSAKSVEKEFKKSVAETELSKSVSEKESLKSVPEKEMSKFISEKEPSKSVSEKESSKSVSEKESSKSIAEKESIKSIAKKEFTKSVTEKESTESISKTQHTKNEHETNTTSDEVNTNGLQFSTNSTVTKQSSSLSQSKNSTHLLKLDESNQNIKSSRNKQNSNEKQLKDVSRRRNYSTDEKDSSSDENEPKILECKASSVKSRIKPEPESSSKVSKEISKKGKNKSVSEESTNESSSDSGEYKSDEERKMRKRTPSREVKRRRSKNESSSESSSSESRESSPERLSKIPVKKPKIDNIEKTDEIKEKCPVDTSLNTGDKTKVGDKVTKDVSSSHVRQRLKIKRDNVVLEERISPQESSTEKDVRQAETRSDASESKNEQHDLQSIQPKDTEITEEIPKPYVSRKVVLSNRKQSRSSVEENEESTHKKSKWGSFATAQKNSRNISISTTSLKSWFPEFKLISEPVPANEAMSMEQIPSLSEEKIVGQAHGNEGGTHKQSSWSNDPMEQDVQSPMEESIEQGPVSKIIFIQNLVRPFTLSQLKDLLKLHGNFIEGQFWIDKIKSKCIVVYESEEAAVKAKNALNNSRWPPSNPKILTVQYINEEEIEFFKRGSEPPKTIPEPPVEAIECYDVKTISPIEERRKDREHKREKEKVRPQVPLREWDKDKIVQDSPERGRFVNKENEKIKAVEKKERKESKRRSNDDTPAKLLDDLFQKTKASPCIYWLPLTEEQIKEKAEEKRMKKLEYEKRSLKEQEDGDRKSKLVRSGQRSRDRELQRSSSRSRSPVSRRR